MTGRTGIGQSPSRSRRGVALLLLVAVAATVVAVLVHAGTDGDDGAPSETLGLEASAWRGLVGSERPEVAVGERVIVVLEGPSLAQRVARAGGLASSQQQRRWTAAALATQQQLIAELAIKGIRVRPDFTYTRVMAGFSAVLDAPAIAVLERRDDVEGVYAVRVAYPAAEETPLLEPDEEQPGRYDADVGLPGFGGRGVTIALLDTGVDRFHPALHGRVREGFDVVAKDESALAEAPPGRPADLERHGTQLAGILVGAGGPGLPDGIAPRAGLLPIRVGGWQPDASGGFAVYARTDQVIAGLERAVDPNRDGDAQDAARIAVLGLAEPFAAFPDSPTARAAAGALALDTLVVVPAGNDGPAGPRYGRVSGPGGAAAALTVGAADLRPETRNVRVTLRAGLEVEFAGAVSLAGPDAPEEALSLRVAAPRTPSRPSGIALDDFFDSRGFSLVAGRAALVPAGEAPERAAEAAVRAGAAAVVLHGARLPSEALALPGGPAVPVVSVPADAATRTLDALRRGASARIAIGGTKADLNSDASRVAVFSSRGLAFDGRVKPDLVAPGVSLLAAEPGENENGTARYGIVSGSSAAAALVAGSAALLAQARTDLDALSLKGVLVGSAQPLPRESVRAQGAGVVDIGAAAAAEVAASPTTLSFGGHAGALSRRLLVVRNVSTRILDIRVRSAPLRASAARIRLRPARSARVWLTARAGYTAAPVEGAVELVPAGGGSIRVPWVVVPRPVEPDLIGSIVLEPDRFKPSDSAPAVLAFRAGSILRSEQGEETEPVARLELELRRENGRKLGLLAQLRNLLPGQFLYGLTGRGPGGKKLRPGGYVLRLAAYPTGGGPPTRREVPFTIEE
jgi:subtilisin family serine protease